MKNFLITLFVLAQINCNAQNTMITGKINGLGDGVISIDPTPLNNLDSLLSDTINVINGEFTIKKEISSFSAIMLTFDKFTIKNRPTGGTYTPDNSFFYLFVSPGDNITITGEFNNKGERYLSIKGNDISSDWANIENRLAKTLTRSAIEEIEYEKGLVEKNKAIIELGKQNRIERRNSKVKERLAYAKSNPDKELSAFIVANLPIDSIGKYYNLLSDNVKQSCFKDLLDASYSRYQEYQEYLISKEKIKTGSAAPDFEALKIDSTMFNLSDIKGKYIVLEFWGTWCGYCIKEIPQLKELYSQVKDKIEFIGIASNEKDFNDWMRKTEKLDLPWINIIDNAEDKISVKYAIGGYPTKVIISPSGEIKGIYNGASEEFYKVINTIFTEINHNI